MSSTPIPRKPSPSDVSDEDWSFVAPYLTLLPQDAGQRKDDRREVFNGVRSIVRTGAQWRLMPPDAARCRTMPHDLPPWPLVDQQMRRWMAAGSFEALVHDLRVLLRRAADRPTSPTVAHRRPPSPTVAILDRRTIQSTPESGARAGSDGHKRRKGSTVHAAVDPLGHLLARLVTAANKQDRAQMDELAAALQEATGQPVELADVDQGYTG